MQKVRNGFVAEKIWKYFKRGFSSWNFSFSRNNKLFIYLKKIAKGGLVQNESAKW